jgi:hypothetical protein
MLVADWDVIGRKFWGNFESLPGFDNLVTFISKALKMGHPKACKKHERSSWKTPGALVWNTIKFMSLCTYLTDVKWFSGLSGSRGMIFLTDHDQRMELVVHHLNKRQCSRPQGSRRNIVFPDCVSHVRQPFYGSFVSWVWRLVWHAAFRATCHSFRNQEHHYEGRRVILLADSLYAKVMEAVKSRSALLASSQELIC